MSDRPTHLAACGIDGGFGAVALSPDGRLIWQRAIEFRAHDVIADPGRLCCIVVGRKPGPMALLCDLATGDLRGSLKPLPGCTFDGHAVFSPDGATIYTTQSEGKKQLGRIGIYRAADASLIGGYSTHGIEPHELIWSVDGVSLVVGNGGIVDRNATDPIDSSLVRLDAATGMLVSKSVLDEDDETLSLRHLARLADGRIVCGAQDQDPATDLRALVFIVDRGGEVLPLSLPGDAHRRLAGYIGSVAVDTSGQLICATSPRGGLSVFWSADGAYLGHDDLADVCGVAAGGKAGQFLLTSGHGRSRLVTLAESVSASELPAMALQWDNHLSRSAA